VSARRPTFGWGLVAALGLIALLTAPVTLPRIGNIVADPSRIHPLALLPAHISVCGRDWRKDNLNRVLTIAEIRARDRVEPIIVDYGLLGTCPDGPCTNITGGPCDTVVYVRVDEDGYVDYELQGGP
jgi:hypothetical protein